MISSAPATPRPSRLRAGLRPWLAGLVGALALVACGGGDPIVAFEPTRMVAFGDETSALTADGRKYGVNRVADGQIDCAANANWVQRLALNFGLVFAECNAAAATPTASLRAVAGARAADVQQAIADFIDADAPTGRDLASVLVGMHDVLAAYAQYPGRSEAALAAELDASARALARSINRLALAGPAVIVATVPDLGLTPYAVAEKAAHADADRAALLTRLTAAFNRGLRLEVINDGRLIGMVFADEQVQTMVRFPTAFSLTNVVTAACANAAAPPEVSPAALLDCTSAGLVTDATEAGWLWADSLRLGPTGQSRLGLVAISRARNNPF